MADKFDVIEVEIKNPHTVHVMDRDKDERNAEAFIKMAIARRGVETHFYKAVPAGKYNDGDALF